MKNFVLIFLLISIMVFTSGFKNEDQVDLKDNNVNFDKIFKDYEGTFVLYDFNNNSYFKYNEVQANQRVSPCSTFKIFNSLVGLQTGVVKDENTMKKWDEKKYSIKSWNKDHTLKTAIANSVVWYYQDVACDIGRDRMKNYLDKVGYGNKEIGSRIDMFWLDNSLKISPKEQVDFLTKLYKEELPFNDKVINIVKKIIVLEKENNIIFSGKTGSNGKLGWFVGYLYNNGNRYTFATNIKAENGAYGWKAKIITKNILRELNLLN
ncbi:hypothetical protein U472_15450 [Orenia metallireducens]|uniref:beta-lactamase n=1 Tax=Orenia metallireducens TaxID=1413210 RepID=A0A1C0A6F3_9FIRM|nr:class D beta-lactamase [Orenia metallireducens]OCL25721.1 hypothetical protein U472_15450 [Orenia metallireducens]